MSFPSPIHCFLSSLLFYFLSLHSQWQMQEFFFIPYTLFFYYINQQSSPVDRLWPKDNLITFWSLLRIVAFFCLRKGQKPPGWLQHHSICEPFQLNRNQAQYCNIAIDYSNRQLFCNLVDSCTYLLTCLLTNLLYYRGATMAYQIYIKGSRIQAMTSKPNGHGKWQLNLTFNNTRKEKKRFIIYSEKLLSWWQWSVLTLFDCWYKD